MNIENFKLEVPQTRLDDLKSRLQSARWPDSIDDSSWEYGPSVAYMRELSSYWLNEFDWRAQEQIINSFLHFRATINGLRIHFIHQRGSGPDSIPIVITHGWPGSFLEMFKIIPLLTDPVTHGGDAADSFDVVVPSIPGFGLSDRPVKPGMDQVEIAELWFQLMRGLGYQKFAAQGGDFGAGISTWLARLHPDALIGIHLNYIPGSYRPYLADGASLTPAEEKFRADDARWWDEEGAYAHLQGTRPQTLAFALNESPIGLAAWILEKFRDWADCDGDVERCFSKDELLTNISLYWFTETFHSSIRLYNESAARPHHFKKGERVSVPCGIARFAKEAPFPPREWVERTYEVRHWSEFQNGGHFAALEQPEVLVEDIRAFFRPLR